MFISATKTMILALTATPLLVAGVPLENGAYSVLPLLISLWSKYGAARLIRHAEKRDCLVNAAYRDAWNESGLRRYRTVFSAAGTDASLYRNYWSSYSKLY